MKTNTMKKKAAYYNVKESFTSRTDIDPYLKWILTHMDSKLRIPPERLKDAFIPGKYTFCVSQVSKALGLLRATTQNKFKLLERLKIIHIVGTRITDSGEVVVWDVNRPRFKKLMGGEIVISKSNPTDSEGCQPDEQPCQLGEQGRQPDIQGCQSGDTSTKREYQKGSIQKQYSNRQELFLISGSAKEPNNHTGDSMAPGSLRPEEQGKTTTDNSQSGQNTAGNGDDWLQEFDAVFGKSTTSHKPGIEPEKHPQPSMAPGPEPGKVTISSTVPGPGPDLDELRESIKDTPDPALLKWKVHQMGRI